LYLYVRRFNIRICIFWFLLVALCINSV
jgi:hypothetical protein